MESAITAKWQITIPKEIREHLGLKPGDRLKFFLHPDGTVVLLPKLSARSLRGMVRSRRRRPALQRAAAKPGVIDDFIGCLSQRGRRKLAIDQIKDIAAQGWAKQR